MRSFFFFILLWAAFTVCRPAWALDGLENVQIHGFASQGYLHSSKNNFLANSRSGTGEFTDLALNANISFWQDFRLGGQLFYRNLGDHSEDRVVVDWALLEYQPYDQLGLRIGKVKMPLGLYNETRDFDFLQPMIFLPQSIYDESRRDSNLAYLGAGVYGNILLGRWGDVDYHLYAGETDFPDKSIQVANTEQSVEALIERNSKLPASKRNPLIPSSFSSVDRESEDLYGGALVFNSSLTGLRFGATLLHSKSELHVNGSSVPAGETVIHSKYVLSTEYYWRDWLFVGEYGETDRTSELFGKENLDGPSQSWYLMVSHSPLDRWTLSALYDEFYRLKHDKHSKSRPQAPPETGWRKDFGFGVRYDVNDRCNIKAEYHYIDGTAMQLNVVNPEGTDRYWSYFAAKVSISF